MFIALSRFVVSNAMAPAVRAAFVARPGLVDKAEGFIRMEVLSPRDNRDEFWLLTWWTEEACYHNWHRSHHYHESHKNIPKGLKLVPRSAQIRFFDHVAS